MNTSAYATNENLLPIFNMAKMFLFGTPEEYSEQDLQPMRDYWTLLGTAIYQPEDLPDVDA